MIFFETDFQIFSVHIVKFQNVLKCDECFCQICKVKFYVVLKLTWACRSNPEYLINRKPENRKMEKNDHMAENAKNVIRKN